MYYSTGRFAEAEQSARRALDADAYLSDAATVIADLYFAMLLRERFDEAQDWCQQGIQRFPRDPRSEEHTSELQSQSNLVCRLLLEKKKRKRKILRLQHAD